MLPHIIYVSHKWLVQIGFYVHAGVFGLGQQLKTIVEQNGPERNSTYYYTVIKTISNWTDVMVLKGNLCSTMNMITD